MTEIAVTPLYKLRNDARAMKQEAEFMKQRSAQLDEQQRALTQDIADIEKAQLEVAAIVDDYAKKLSNLRIVHGELRTFAQVEQKSLADNLPEVANKLNKLREDVAADIRKKGEAHAEKQKAADAADATLREKQKALKAAQDHFDRTRSDAKGGLDAAKAYREQANGSADRGEKYILAGEVASQLTNDPPSVADLQKRLAEALAGLLKAKTEYSTASLAAKAAQMELAKAKDASELAQRERLETLRAAAKNAVNEEGVEAAAAPAAPARDDKPARGSGGRSGTQGS